MSGFLKYHLGGHYLTFFYIFVPMKGNLGLVVGASTFVLFMTEAIIHFNMGQQTKSAYYGEKQKKKSMLELPKKSELMEIALIVGIFSVINGVVVNEIKKAK